MRNIIIIGRIHTDNLGDRIIGRTMRNLFDRPDLKIFSADYTIRALSSSSRVYNRLIRPLVDRLYKARCKRVIKKSEMAIIGGGELISSGFLKDLKEWNLMFEINNPGIKRVLFGVGVVENFSKSEENELRSILRLFHIIYLRDYDSLKYIKEINDNPSCKIEYLPDPVFSYKYNNDSLKIGISFGITDMRRHIKHGYVKFRTKQELFEFYYENLRNLIDKYGEKRVNIIYNSDNDKIVAMEFSEYCKREWGINAVVPLIQNEDCLIHLISSSRALASPRMHACIIGLLCGIDVKPIIISDKMKKFAELYCGKEIDIEYLSKQIINAANKIVE